MIIVAVASGVGCYTFNVLVLLVIFVMGVVVYVLGVCRLKRVQDLYCSEL